MGFLKGLFRLTVMLWVIITVLTWIGGNGPLETILKSQWAFVTEEIKDLKVFED